MSNHKRLTAIAILCLLVIATSVTYFFVDTEVQERGAVESQKSVASEAKLQQSAELPEEVEDVVVAISVHYDLNTFEHLAGSSAESAIEHYRFKGLKTQMYVTFDAQEKRVVEISQSRLTESTFSEGEASFENARALAERVLSLPETQFESRVSIGEQDKESWKFHRDIYHGGFRDRMGRSTIWIDRLNGELTFAMIGRPIAPESLEVNVLSEEAKSLVREFLLSTGAQDVATAEFRVRDPEVVRLASLFRFEDGEVVEQLCDRTALAYSVSVLTGPQDVSLFFVACEDGAIGSIYNN